MRKTILIAATMILIVVMPVSAQTAISSNDETTVQRQPEETTEQEAKKNNLQISFGFVHNRLINVGYTNSQLLFRGTNAKFGLGYGRETNNNVIKFSAEASFGDVRSKSGNLPSSFVLIHPSLTYLRTVKEYRAFEKENIFFAGIHLSSINYLLENEPIFDNIDIFSLHGIYLGFSNRLVLNKTNRLHVTYVMPVLVYENRVLWNGGASDITYDDRDHLLKTLVTRGQFSYFSIARNIQFEADYIVSIGRNTDLEIGYRFSYLNVFSEAPIRMYSNELLFGLKFRF